MEWKDEPGNQGYYWIYIPEHNKQDPERCVFLGLCDTEGKVVLITSLGYELGTIKPGWQFQGPLEVPTPPGINFQ